MGAEAAGECRLLAGPAALAAQLLLAVLAFASLAYKRCAPGAVQHCYSRGLGSTVFDGVQQASGCGWVRRATVLLLLTSRNGRSPVKWLPATCANVATRSLQRCRNGEKWAHSRRPSAPSTQCAQASGTPAAPAQHLGA